MFAGLPLEERIAAIGTTIFVLIAGLLIVILFQLNLANDNAFEAAFGEQMSRQLASQARYDTFNNEVLSLNAILRETIESPLIVRARIIGLDGEVLVEAKTNDLQFSMGNTYRSEIAFDNNVVGYSEILLAGNTMSERRSDQLLSFAALLFAASITCYLILRLLATRVSAYLKDINVRLEEKLDGPIYPHRDQLAKLLDNLFLYKLDDDQEQDDASLQASTVIAVRIHDWSNLTRQVDKLILEQIARQLQQCVETVADRTMLPWKPAPGGFDIHFEAQEFDASTAADTLVIAELLLRVQKLVDQQRLREGKIAYAIGIGIGEVIPPALHTQSRQPTLMSQLAPLAHQQANYFASAAEANSFVVSEKFIGHWSLQTVLEDAAPHPKVRAALYASQLKAPYSDIVEQHFQAMIKD